MIRRVLYFKNSKPALIIAVKQIKTIDADEDHITALKAEAKAIKAELAALAAEAAKAFTARPSVYAFA